MRYGVSEDKGCRTTMEDVAVCRVDARNDSNSSLRWGGLDQLATPCTPYCLLSSAGVQFSARVTHSKHTHKLHTHNMYAPSDPCGLTTCLQHLVNQLNNTHTCLTSHKLC